MSCITIPQTAAAPEGSQATLNAINDKLGRVPNLVQQEMLHSLWERP